MGIIHTVSLFPGVFHVFFRILRAHRHRQGYQYNLVPFKEITRYFRYYDVLGPTLFMINMIGNVAAFMPFGFFLPIISRRSKKWYNTVMFGFVFSLMLETLQLVFKVGSFDVDDMLLNTLGAAAGYLCYRLVQWTRCKLRKRRLSR